MKNFQQNLLITLALGLCGLCAWQWYAQTQQRNQIDGLNRLVYEKSLAIRDYTNSIATLNHQIGEMDLRITELKGTVKTNEELLTIRNRELNQLRTTNESLTNQIVEYKEGVAALQTKLKEAYDDIKKQNASLQELLAQRDEFVRKYNDSVKDRNDIVAKYNDLATQVRKLQGGTER